LATEVDTVLGQVTADGPDALLVVVQSPGKAELTFAALAKRAQRLPLFGNDVVLGATDVLAQYPAVVEGLVGADVSVDETSAAYQQFAAQYEATYGEPLRFGAYAVLSYDAIRLLAEAMVSAGTTPDAIRAYLNQVKDWPGVAGPLTLDEHGDPTSGHVLKRVAAGAVVTAPAATPAP
jgi:branched-chain amino acid transport system substrate-binding protein